MALLENANVSYSIRDYIKEPLSLDELEKLLKLLKMNPSELVRKKEMIYKDQGLDGASDKDLIKAMVKYPKLIERPIIVQGKKALIARPPEKLKEIL